MRLPQPRAGRPDLMVDARKALFLLSTAVLSSGAVDLPDGPGKRLHVDGSPGQSGRPDSAIGSNGGRVAAGAPGLQDSLTSVGEPFKISFAANAGLPPSLVAGIPG